MPFAQEVIHRLHIDSLAFSLDDPTLPNLNIRFESRTTNTTAAQRVCVVSTDLQAPTEVLEWLKNQAPCVKGFADDLSGKLCVVAERLFRLLRWFSGGTSGHDPLIAVGPLQFSPDGMNWKRLPTTVSFNLSFGIPELKPGEDLVSGVHHLWAHQCEEPLAHELLREAADQQFRNRRSSLIMSIAAAEVGLKQLIGTLIPDAKWLANNTPSPPLATMLAEYMPLLPTAFRVNGQIPKVPKVMLDTIKKGVSLRNRIIHSEALVISSKTLLDVLRVTHDCVYLYDCFAGHTWAWERITAESRRHIHSGGETQKPTQGVPNRTSKLV